MIKKITDILRKPYLTLIFFLAGVMVCIIGAVQSVCVYRPSSGLATGPRIGGGYIGHFDVSDGGCIAMNIRFANSDGFICSADLTNGKMAYMVSNDLLGEYCGVFSRYDVILGSGSEIWLHYVSWSESNTAIDAEGILRISQDGKSVALVGGIDYSGYDDPPTRVPRLSAFSYDEDVLRFAYSDLSGAEFYRIDGATGTQICTGKYTPDEGVFVGKVFSLSDGFMLVMSDGRVVRAGYDGSLHDDMYYYTADISDHRNTDMISAAAEVSGKLYVAVGIENDRIFQLEKGSLIPAADLSSLNSGDISVKHLAAADGKLFLTAGGSDPNSPDSVCVFDGNEIKVLDTAFEMPLLNALASNLPLISLVLLGISLILFIIFAVYVKKSLLFKQLLFTIPVMIVICILICRQASEEIIGTYIEQSSVTSMAVCDICADHIDGDEIRESVREGRMSTEQYGSIRSELLSAVDYNRSYWNGMLDLRIVVPDDNGICLTLADTRRIAVPFTEQEDYFDVGLHEQFLEDEGISSYVVSDDKYKWVETLLPESGAYMVVAGKSVCDRAGEVCAYLVVSTEDFSLGVEQSFVLEALLQAIVPYMILLMVMISLISAIISAMIRRATRTVKKIAEGDLTARIKNNSGDELGEICRQVNVMASNLEVIFAEKDKNERFYYKFVPEKFRELLGKEKITDLALGDAESREFSVLFCDIRSFSINSEMMTAKENFEFVNVIFGIAGPIIRNHGGFVDKYIGDAVMALFESPDDAVKAGVELYRSIVLDPSTAEKLNVRDINVGIGIHTGMARIGIVGEDERMSGTVISDTVNLSSRLESLTKIYNTAMLVSKDTIDRMTDPDSLNKRYVGMIQVAGVNDVNAVYEVLECLGEEEKNRRTANKEDFREAVRLFHLGRRAESVELLRKIRDEGRSDSVSEMYLEYIENMSAEDKGNVFRFVRK